MTARRLAVAAAALLLVTLVVVLRSGGGTIHVTAHFPASVGVYEGSEVRLMGVPIGTVTEIVPEGTTVRVEMEYDASYDVPADARAVIVAPSVVSDRFVQLTPGYSGSGPTLADDDVIPEERTRVPVELDQVFSTANDLLVALGPQGANDEGAVNRLLEVGADNLRGQGPALRAMLRELSGATSTLGESSDDFFTTVGHLARLTDELARHDEEIGRFNAQLADIARFLAGEREELSLVLANLARSFGQVEDFVVDNRDLFASNLQHLVEISDALVAEREALEEIQRVLPVGLNNLVRTADEKNQTIRSRANFDQLLKDLEGVICDAVRRAGVPTPQAVCDALSSTLGGLG